MVETLNRHQWVYYRNNRTTFIVTKSHMAPWTGRIVLDSWDKSNPDKWYTAWVHEGIEVSFKEFVKLSGWTDEQIVEWKLTNAM